MTLNIFNLESTNSFKEKHHHVSPLGFPPLMSFITCFQADLSGFVFCVIQELGINVALEKVGHASTLTCNVHLFACTQHTNMLTHVLN